MDGAWNAYATGLATILLVMLAWVAVQTAWRRVFADLCDDPDALAGRGGCVGCKRQGRCRRPRRETDTQSKYEEDVR